MEAPVLHREKQPTGNEGIAYSLRQVARLAAEGRTDPMVVAFARRCCRDAGYPSTAMGRARAIWDGVRKQGIRWVPDPVRSEWMAKARHLLPSGEGKDDALLVAGDCDELSLLYGALYCAACQSVDDSGQESCVVLGHAYGAGQRVSHVLNAVFDEQSRSWVRVDLSGDWGFGSFKKPSWEVMISLPSGEVICQAESCSPRPAAAIGSFDHVRLEGLPRAPSQSEFFALGALPDGVLDEFVGVLEGQVLNLGGLIEEYDQATTSMKETFDRLQMTAEERAATGWNEEYDRAGLETLDAARIYLQAVDDVLAEKRRWAITPEGNYLIEALSSDKKKVTSEGRIVDAFAPVTSGALGAAQIAPPVAIAAIVAAGVVISVVAYFSITEGLKLLSDLARRAETLAVQKRMAECTERFDPERCATLQKAIGESQAAVEAEVAAQKEAEARQAEAKTSMIKWGLVVVAAGAAIGVGVYTGALPMALSAVKAWVAKKRG